MPDFILEGTTAEDYEKAGSKFAKEGLHLSEMGMPDWKNAGASFVFPFTIIEEGEDNGKVGEFYPSAKKTGLFKLKEILTAIGVNYKIVGGNAAFNSDECVGKKFYSVWTTQKDLRKPEDGGTGNTYTKPIGAKSIAEVEKSGKPAPKAENEELFPEE
jgi:hypothetical protein